MARHPNERNTYLTLHRVIDAPVETVYAAWTESPCATVARCAFRERRASGCIVGASKWRDSIPHRLKQSNSPQRYWPEVLGGSRLRFAVCSPAASIAAGEHFRVRIERRHRWMVRRTATPRATASGPP